ncbi:MAG TPA: protein kinase [Gemmatimonadales bacterium]
MTVDSTSADRLKAALADRYTIERELGAGGMATVYLAHDVKHDRRVAVKVLRPELAAVLGAERFLNEIRVTANLQHPHILPLFDSGAADGFLYYVMPHVEGEALSDKLAREKQLAVEEAVKLASETASALDYAHRNGVIHRDIKPANILLHDGSALVADFGIALALRAAGGDRLTETGLSLGTPHYMSPEQATGDRDVDARTDIYSVGAVLYEALAGEPPHTGGTIQAVISKLITEAPRPLGDLRHSVPAHVALTVEKALAKIPADRFATAAEFASALRDPSITVAYARATRAGQTATTSARWLDWRAAVAGIALLLIGVAGGQLLTGDAAPSPVVGRFLMPLETSHGLTGAPVNTLALSPDGQSVVYVGRASGSGIQLYVRRLDELAAHPIPGTEGGAFPAFSPDGTRVAYFGPGGLFVVPLGGGAATHVSNAAAGALTQVIWLDDQTIIGNGSDGSLVLIGLDGHTATLARPDSGSGEVYFSVNAVLPGARTVLAVSSPTFGVNGPVIAINVETGRRSTILDAPTNTVWYADGHLLWAQPGGAVLGARFDTRTLTPTGPTVTVAEGVRTAVGGQAQVAVSATGSLVYVPEQPFDLVLLDRTGTREVVAEKRRFHSPRFSPDGRRLAVDFQQQGSRDVWVLDLAQRTLSRVSFENDGHDPVWTPDGRSIAYVTRGGIHLRRADGSGVAEPLYAPPGFTSLLSFSPDGHTAFTAPTGTNGFFDIGVLTVDEPDQHRMLLASPFNEQYAVLAPDGRWLAYGSDETGLDEVYVRPFPEGGGKVLVSQGGGREPMWSPDGRQLYYLGEREGITHLMVAAVTAGPDFAVRDRRALFDVSEFEPASPHANYDVSPDGSTFAMVYQGPLSAVVYLLNWTELVRRQARSEGR